MPEGKFSWEQDESERTQVMRAYKAIFSSQRVVSWTNRSRIRKAFEFAARAHNGVRRKSGESYILHPLAVARVLVDELGVDDHIAIMCALLHDVVEDTSISLDEIEKNFGPKCRQIIDGLTKIKKAGYLNEQVSEQAENFRRLLLTISHDIRVILIKLADRLHNMRTMGAMKEEKALKIASETMWLYAPLANRLGLYQIKSELEDLSFRHLNPDEYKRISEKREEVIARDRPYMDAFRNIIEGILKEGGIKYRIKYRFKSVYSIHRKMERQGIPFEEVYDLFAVRIIVKPRSPEEETESCWRVYSALTEKYLPNTRRLRDWISVPKENGYESLHTTLRGPENRWVEVQIRTERMDEIAEKGIAAHWKYKDPQGTNPEPSADDYLTSWIMRVREILENPDLDAIEAVNEFRQAITLENNFVFTPKGEMIRMPAFATALDFAYKIHTRIGDHAISAKVHNELKPLDYELRSGDLVEIITSSKSQVKEEWLNYVSMQKTKEMIRKSLAAQRRQATERGVERFKELCTEYGIDVSRHAQLRELLFFLKQPKIEDLHYEIGSQKLDLNLLKEFVELKKQGKEIESVAIEDWEKKILKRYQQYREMGIDMDQMILPTGQDIQEYRLAKCCEPVKGDYIMGLLRGNTIEIHRSNCKTATRLMANEGSSIVQVRWKKGLQKIDFLAAVKVVGIDKQGMLGDLVTTISGKKINISKVSIEAQDNMFEGVFHVFVENTEALDDLIVRLKAIENVKTAARVGRDYTPFQKMELH